MVFKCKTCGAKLNIKRGAQLVKCEYCESVNKIELITSKPTPGRPRPTKKQRKINRIIFYVLSISIGVLLIITKTIENRGILKYYEGYLIDHNNDEYLDIVSFSANHKKGEVHLNIIDGKTGERIKKLNIDNKNDGKLFVLDQNFIGIAGSNFLLSIYERKNLEKIKTYNLSDELNYYEFKDNTLFFSTSDRNLWKINFNNFDLKQTKFDIELNKKPAMTNSVNQIKDADILYVAEEKEYSSKDLFSISAKNNGIVLWKLPLNYEYMNHFQGPVLVVSEKNIITYGKKIGSDGSDYLIGIDKIDRKIKYEVEVPGIYISEDFCFNGKYIIVKLYYNYYAFDPDNGDLIWGTGKIRDR